MTEKENAAPVPELQRRRDESAVTHIHRLLHSIFPESKQIIVNYAVQSNARNIQISGYM